MALIPVMLLMSACSSGTGTVTIGTGSDPTTVSNIAFLAGVVLSDGDNTRVQTDATGTPLDPKVTAWSSNKFYYSYVVSSVVSTITITPVALDTTQPPTILISGGGLTATTVATGTASPDIALPDNGTLVITIAVTAADNRTQQTYTIRVNRLAATSSTLTTLTLSNNASLSPAFSPTTSFYTATVPYEVTSITATPQSQDPQAAISLSINGGTGSDVPSGTASAAIPLTIATPTLIDIKVTATDGVSIQAYQVAVTRQGSGNLTGLSLLTGVLTPNFQSSVYAYTSSQNYLTTQTTLTPIAAEGGTATIKANGGGLIDSIVLSGSPSSIINLCTPAPCDTLVTLEVTSSNGSTKQTYTLTLHHDAPPFVQQQAYIKASDTHQCDQLGQSVAVAGDTLAVGAYNQGNLLPTSCFSGLGLHGSGAAYVYLRDSISGNWSQQDELKASNPGAQDQFGWSVALSTDGNTLAVGAPLEDSPATLINGSDTNDCINPSPSNCAQDSGAVFIFTRSGTTWSQEAYIKASNTGGGDHFGWSLALSTDGNTLAVGAPLEDSDAQGIGGSQLNDNAGDSGAVYLYTRSGGTWTHQAYIKGSDTVANDHFGWSVAIAPDGTLAIGAPTKGAFISGAVYAFTGAGAGWSEDIKLAPANEIAGLGYSVAIAGNNLVAGAPYIRGTGSARDQAGAVYAFARTAGVWDPTPIQIIGSNTAGGDQFGFGLALSGNSLLVAAPFEDSNGLGVGDNNAQSNDSATNAGAAYLFTLSAGIWSQQAYIKASNTNVDDNFGSSAALSGDGAALTAAVGAPYEGSAANIINGIQSDNSMPHAGAAYVFVPF